MRLSWSSMSGLHPKAVVLTSHGRGDGRKGEMEDGHSRVEGGGRGGATTSQCGTNSSGSVGEGFPWNLHGAWPY